MRLKLHERLKASSQDINATLHGGITGGNDQSHIQQEVNEGSIKVDGDNSSDEEWFLCNESEGSGGSGVSGGNQQNGEYGGSGGNGGSGGSGEGGNGFDGEEVNYTEQNTPRYDLEHWKQWDNFHHTFHCDFDYISITRSHKILPELIGECSQISIPDRLQVGAQSKTTSTSNTMCIGGAHPYYIYVEVDYKEENLRRPNVRGVTYPPATNNSLLLFKSITMNSKDYCDMLEIVGIQTVTYIG